MQKMVWGIVLAALVLASMATVAATDIDVNGQVRFRDEIDLRSFDSARTAEHYCDLRTRVGFDAKVNDNVSAFVQFQNWRHFGHGGSNFMSPQNTWDDQGRYVEIHQGYLQVNRFLVDGLGIKFGRFEFVHGNQRVFGGVGWSNVGRAMEGGQLWYAHERFTLKAFRLHMRENDNEFYNADFDIFGGILSKPGLIKFEDKGRVDVDLFGFLEYDADTAGHLNNVNELNRLNFGTYLTAEHGDLDFTGNFVLQTGKAPCDEFDATVTDSVIATTENDISAMMFFGEAGFSFEKGRIAAGIDYSSGDDNATDTKYKAYQNSYYTGHKFRGYMDYFVASDEAGLMDIFFRGSYSPNGLCKVAGDLHLFSTAVDYVDPTVTTTTSMTKDVGMEIDITASSTAVDGITFQAGGSVFMAKDAFAMARSNSANPEKTGFWAYFMMTVDF
ncbi:MAG: alginate export family protein [bacterium]